MKAETARECTCPFSIENGEYRPCLAGKCMAWRFFTFEDCKAAVMLNIPKDGGYCGRIGKEGAV